jgi:hypothetical protein
MREPRRANGEARIQECYGWQPDDHPTTAALAPQSSDVASLQGANGSPRERDDNYNAVIVYLDDGTRIIECADRIQWIWQRPNAGRWRSISFFRDRDVLIERTGAVGEALVCLRALPRRHP